MNGSSTAALALVINCRDCQRFRGPALPSELKPTLGQDEPVGGGGGGREGGLLPRLLLLMGHGPSGSFAAGLLAFTCGVFLQSVLVHALSPFPVARVSYSDRSLGEALVCR